MVISETGRSLPGMTTVRRRRLDHVDAMRPIKQAGVVTTHTIVNFVPAAAGVGSGTVLLLLHVSREGFFFISACMLAYAYADLNLGGLRRFYWRRFLSVGVPYLCWTLIYFFFLMPTAHYHGVGPALRSLATMAETGYYQLYFLMVIMQFYVVFPLAAVLLRRTKGHHGLVGAGRRGQAGVGPIARDNDPFGLSPRRGWNISGREHVDYSNPREQGG
jgi:peptidoglycan/LPS O-acetylase OafA/YrhL